MLKITLQRDAASESMSLILEGRLGGPGWRKSIPAGVRWQQIHKVEPWST